MMIDKSLIEVQSFKKMLEECEAAFQAKRAELSDDKFVEFVLSRPTEWKYSKGDFFYPLPYRDEMAGFQPAKLLKKTYRDTDEASLKGFYSSGFLEGVHLVTRHPLELKDVLDICFFERVGAEIMCFNIRGYRGDGGRKDVVKSVEKMVVNDNEIMNAIYAGDGNFSLNLLSKNAQGEVEKEYVYANGWVGNDVYKYIHCDGGLKEVRGLGKSGDFDVVIWQRNT